MHVGERSRGRGQRWPSLASRGGITGSAFASGSTGLRLGSGTAGTTRSPRIAPSMLWTPRRPTTQGHGLQEERSQAFGVEEPYPLVTVASILATTLTSSPHRRARGVRRQSASSGKGFRHLFPCPRSEGVGEEEDERGLGWGANPFSAEGAENTERTDHKGHQEPRREETPGASRLKTRGLRSVFGGDVRSMVHNYGWRSHLPSMAQVPCPHASRKSPHLLLRWRKEGRASGPGLPVSVCDRVYCTDL